MAEYPKWIGEYTASLHNAFVGMVPSRWGSIDYFAILPRLQGTFIDKVHEAVTKLKAAGKTPEELITVFSCPSTLRCALYFLAEEYRSVEQKNKVQCKEVMEYLVSVLRAWTPNDTFALSTNQAHTPQEVGDILAPSFGMGSVEVARELGRLYNSAAAVAFALYRDMFPQDSHEVYGPYDASEKFGAGAVLVIKDFPKIKPLDLWPGAKDFRHARVRIFQVYKGVDFTCDWIGMHSKYQGDLMQGLVAFGVEIDGVWTTDVATIKEVRLELESVAVEQSKVYEGMDYEAWLHKTLEWECYQFNKFFELAGMDWRPTQKMLNAVAGVQANMGFGVDSFPSIEEYATSPEFEVYWLKDLYRS